MLAAVDQSIADLNSKLQRATLRQDDDDHRHEAPLDISVAVVDDDPEVCLIVAVALSLHGLDVRPVDGRNVNLVRNPETWAFNFDLVLMDYMMPTLGTDVAKVVEAISPSTKVVMMTAWPYLPADRPSELSAYPVLEKPFTIDELVSLIREQFDD